MKKQGEHGGVFAYKTINTDVLAWIVRRVSGQSLSSLLSDADLAADGMLRRMRFIRSIASASRAAAVA